MISSFLFSIVWRVSFARLLAKRGGKILKTGNWNELFSDNFFPFGSRSLVLVENSGYERYLRPGRFISKLHSQIVSFPPRMFPSLGNSIRARNSRRGKTQSRTIHFQIILGLIRNLGHSIRWTILGDLSCWPLSVRRKIDNRSRTIYGQFPLHTFFSLAQTFVELPSPDTIYGAKKVASFRRTYFSPFSILSVFFLCFSFFTCSNIRRDINSIHRDNPRIKKVALS